MISYQLYVYIPVRIQWDHKRKLLSIINQKYLLYTGYFPSDSVQVYFTFFALIVFWHRVYFSVFGYTDICTSIIVCVYACTQGKSHSQCNLYSPCLFFILFFSFLVQQWGSSCGPQLVKLVFTPGWVITGSTCEL